MHRIVSQRNQPVELYVGGQVRVFEPFGEMSLDLTDNEVAELQRVSPGLQLLVETVSSTPDTKAKENIRSVADDAPNDQSASVGKTTARRSKSDGL